MWVGVGVGETEKTKHYFHDFIISLYKLRLLINNYNIS